ncbi:MAG: hypothetical protein ACK5MR_12685 [Cumulibacter sp.]
METKIKIEEEFNRPDVYELYPNYPAHVVSDDSDDCPIFTIGTGGAGKTFNELREAIDHFRNQPDYFYNQVGIFFPTLKAVETQISNKNLFDKLLSEEETAEEYGAFISRLVYAKD